MTVTQATAAALRGHISVKYTGRETPFVDRLYDSKLSFDPGQTRSLPAVLAEKLLRHADVFKQVSNEEGQTAEVKVEIDDTTRLLHEAAKDKENNDTIIKQRQNVVDEVNLMDKEALKRFARDKYQQPLEKNRPVEALREQVVGMIDRFGL